MYLKFMWFKSMKFLRKKLGYRIYNVGFGNELNMAWKVLVRKEKVDKLGLVEKNFKLYSKSRMLVYRVEENICKLFIWWGFKFIMCGDGL